MTTTGERLTQDITRCREATEEPCQRCGVRADVGCKHRPPLGLPPIAVAEPEDKEDGRHQSRKNGGQGWAFHRERFKLRSRSADGGKPSGE